MKIYTRTGDDGTTGLLGPGRVLKNAPRVEAYGTVDELNATLGAARPLGGADGFAGELDAIQNALFQIGATLATTVPSAPGGPGLADADVQALEHWIDALEAELPPLRNFVLPGGSALGAQLHVARTVCRRAERRVVALSGGGEDVPAIVIRYLNRLADLLFVMARASNHRLGIADREWKPRPTD